MFTYFYLIFLILYNFFSFLVYYSKSKLSKLTQRELESFVVFDLKLLLLN